MSSVQGLTLEEEAKFNEYLQMFKAKKPMPWIGDLRLGNNGDVIKPEDLLLAPPPHPTAYSEKIDAVFST